MHAILKLFSAYLLITVMACGASRTDEATGLVFPDDVSRWVFVGQKKYEPKAAGVSYSYKSKLSREGAITCYIYNKGMAKIPTGGDSGAVRSEILGVSKVVGETWRRQGGEVQDILGGIGEVKNKDGSVIALMCAHRISVRGIVNVSISAMAAYRDNFMKIRFTFPGDNFDEALNGLGGFKEFVTEMQALNRETLDPLFLPVSTNASDKASQ